MSALASEIIDLVHQIEKRWIWLAKAGWDGNEKKKVDSEEGLVQFNSKQIDDILNDINNSQTLILSMDSLRY